MKFLAYITPTFLSGLDGLKGNQGPSSAVNDSTNPTNEMSVADFRILVSSEGSEVTPVLIFTSR